MCLLLRITSWVSDRVDYCLDSVHIAINVRVDSPVSTDIALDKYTQVWFGEDCLSRFLFIAPLAWLVLVKRVSLFVTVKTYTRLHTYTANMDGLRTIYVSLTFQMLVLWRVSCLSAVITTSRSCCGYNRLSYGPSFCDNDGFYKPLYQMVLSQ